MSGQSTSSSQYVESSVSIHRERTSLDSSSRVLITTLALALSVQSESLFCALSVMSLPTSIF
ncbi:hypothetical protein CEJ39_00015 [Rhodococcus pyridinivorans]|nr:hypothetical protein CEJ39_00015 [Rhodococcus pyridinivorans]